MLAKVVHWDFFNNYNLPLTDAAMDSPTDQELLAAVEERERRMYDESPAKRQRADEGLAAHMHSPKDQELLEAVEERERQMFDESPAKRPRVYEGHDDHNGPDDGVQHDVADAQPGAQHDRPIANVQHDIADAHNAIADAQHDIADAPPAPGSLFCICHIYEVV